MINYIKTNISPKKIGQIFLDGESLYGVVQSKNKFLNLT